MLQMQLYWTVQLVETQSATPLINNNNNNDRLTAFDPGQPG